MDWLDKDTPRDTPCGQQFLDGVDEVLFQGRHQRIIVCIMAPSRRTQHPIHLYAAAKPRGCTHAH